MTTKTLTVPGALSLQRRDLIHRTSRRSLRDAQKSKRVQDFYCAVREMKFDKKTADERGAIFEQWDKDKLNLDDPWLVRNCRNWGVKPSWKKAWSHGTIKIRLQKRIRHAFEDPHYKPVSADH
jgi:hypothetical protein